MTGPDATGGARVDDVAVARVFRREHGRCVATLVRVLGDVGAAEDAVQEAFAVALARWPADGLPDAPGAWITTVARNRAVDRLRRRRRGSTLAAFAATGEPQHADLPEPEEVGPVDDDQLRLVFTCCHPVLAPQARVALTLRLLGGLSTTEVAAAFLTTEQAMQARLVRAKRRLREEQVPYEVPGPDDLAERLAAVLAVVYLVHTTGVDRPAGDAHGDALVAEARRLARLLARLLPDEPEVDGLLAVQPSPVVALNRAVAVAELQGPAAGLRLVDALDLPGYAPLHAVRGDLLARLDRPADARDAFLRGAELATDEAVAAHLRERAAALP